MALKQIQWQMVLQIRLWDIIGNIGYKINCWEIVKRRIKKKKRVVVWEYNIRIDGYEYYPVPIVE